MPRKSKPPPAGPAEPAFVPCSLPRLPAERWAEAAAVACGVNPVNAPLAAMAVALVGPKAADPLFLTLITSKWWGPKGVDHGVRFLDTPGAATRRKILAAANLWGKTANVRFRETTGTGDVRLTRTPGGGYWSYVGTDTRLMAGPTMNLDSFTERTSDAEYLRVVTHEFGHHIGCLHEHMRGELVDRIDPPKAYRYFRQTQGWNNATVEQNVLTALDVRSVFGTPADQDSVMCYQLPGSITRDGRPIAGGNRINARDAEYIAAVYPKK